jgi:3',5'-cyclic AMP phosphodiesterase CpdA
LRALLHISDVHFGPKHLDERAAAVLAVVRDRKPDYVVISGDLTQRAKPAQFAAAKRFVENIPSPTVAVPGNHDVPLYRVWERAFSPFGAYRRHFSPVLEPHVVDDEVCIVGVNTAFNFTLTGGRITRAQRRRVQQLFAAAPPSAYRIAVAHHNLVRPPELDEVPAPLSGSVSALGVLHSSGVDMVLSGHVHQSYVAPIAVAGAAEGGVIVCSGTTTSSRGRGPEAGASTCHWIEIDRAEARVSFFRFDAEASAFLETAVRSFPRRSAAARVEAATGTGGGA